MAAANSTKISWRLRESFPWFTCVIVHECSGNHAPPLCHLTEKFEAHSSTVSCLALGKSSGRLLATGGHDCRVNLWAVSKANCIMVRAPDHVTTASRA